VSRRVDHKLDDGQPVIKIDKTIPPTRVNILALALTLVVMAISFVSYALIWGSASLQAVLGRLISPFLLVFALSIVVHEALHGLGCVLVGRVPRREIKFGFKGLMVYVHCKAPMTASAYRISLMLPGVIMGLIPALVGLAWGSAWLTVYGTLMVIAALGDLMVLWLIRSVPRDARIQDHPSAPGCQILLDQYERGKADD
jgi:succinate dehydrogenase hydrophobic anchor subunit